MSTLNVTNLVVPGTATISATTLNATTLNATTLNATTLQSNTINHTNGTNALLIDSLGRVTRPNVPAFSARQVGGLVISGDVILTTVILNNGNRYDSATGNFIAPVAGIYHFQFQGFTENSASGSSNIEIRRNGSTVVRTFTSEAASVYRPFAICVTLSLSANDTVRPWTGIQLHGNENPIFTGFLL